MIKKNIVVDLTGAYQPVTLDSDADGVANGFRVYCVKTTTGALTPFYYATDVSDEDSSAESAADEALAPANVMLGWPHREQKGKVLFYAKQFEANTQLVVNPGRSEKY